MNILRLTPLAVLAVLAGCMQPAPEEPAPEPEAEAPAVFLPPEVAAALPPGTPPTAAFKGADGCYSLIADGDVKPVTGADGAQICV